MNQLAEAFLSRLHRDHLKGMGFRKTRHTFTRPRNGFTERVQIQGSAWNDRNSPWRFYLNFGITFPDLPSRVPDRDFPLAHCWARVEGIADDAPPWYELSGDDAGVAANVVTVIQSASRRIEESLDELRRIYVTTKSPHLSVRS